MNEIAVRDDNETTLAPAAQPPVMVSGSAIEAWAYEARLAAQIATSLCQTNFVPQSMRGKPKDVAAAILAGQELGMTPLAAMRSIDVIHGTPGLRAHAMRALVQSRGHEVEVVSSSDTECVMRGRRNGARRWQTVTWDIPRAAKLGLTGKDQWRKQPATMLIARATGEICRLIAADVLHAMPYAVEELGGGRVPGLSDATEAEASGAVARAVTTEEITGGPEPLDAEPADEEHAPVRPVEAAPDIAEFDEPDQASDPWDAPSESEDR